MARRPGPSFRALLFGCGAGAVLGQKASFSCIGSESDVWHWGPWPAGPVRPSGPCCLAVAQAPFWVRQLVFLVQKVTLGTGVRGSQARSVPQGPAVWLGPLPAGPLHASDPRRGSSKTGSRSCCSAGIHSRGDE